MNLLVFKNRIQQSLAVNIAGTLHAKGVGVRYWMGGTVRLILFAELMFPGFSVSTSAVVRFVSLQSSLFVLSCSFLEPRSSHLSLLVTGEPAAEFHASRRRWRDAQCRQRQCRRRGLHRVARATQLGRFCRRHTRRNGEFLFEKVT